VRHELKCRYFQQCNGIPAFDQGLQQIIPEKLGAEDLLRLIALFQTARDKVIFRHRIPSDLPSGEDAVNMFDKEVRRCDGALTSLMREMSRSELLLLESTTCASLYEN